MGFVFLKKWRIQSLQTKFQNSKGNHSFETSFVPLRLGHRSKTSQTFLGLPWLLKTNYFSGFSGFPDLTQTMIINVSFHMFYNKHRRFEIGWNNSKLRKQTFQEQSEITVLSRLKLSILKDAMKLKNQFFMQNTNFTLFWSTRAFQDLFSKSGNIFSAENCKKTRIFSLTFLFCFLQKNTVIRK